MNVYAYDAFNNEDPSPSTVACNSLHLHQAKGKNTPESRRDTADEVEEGISLANFISSIPSTK